jgi:hypothetical protein
MRSRELAALRDEQSLELADHGGPGKVGYRRRSRRRFKRARLRELANQRRRLGDRRLFILLQVETSISGRRVGSRARGRIEPSSSRHFLVLG